MTPKQMMSIWAAFIRSLRDYLCDAKMLDRFWKGHFIGYAIHVILIVCKKQTSYKLVCEKPVENLWELLENCEIIEYLVVFLPKTLVGSRSAADFQFSIESGPVQSEPSQNNMMKHRDGH